jgi:hypothetical protein
MSKAENIKSICFSLSLSQEFQQKQQQQERLLAMSKTQPHEDEYANWPVRE